MKITIKAGAQIADDLSSVDIIAFGVKEVDISTLIKDKTYLFFSHTSKVRQYIGRGHRGQGHYI